MNQESHTFFSRSSRLLAVIFCILVTLFLPFNKTTLAEDSTLPLEYRVKAVCIYNFTKYVRWPSIAFATPEDPMNLCFFGDSNPFGNLFESASEKKSQNRSLMLVTLKEKASLAEISACHLLFWTSPSDNAIVPILPQIQNIGVLTVSDTRGLGIVSFFLEEGKVRFEINIEAAKKAGLAISSQLLKLAVVKEE